MKEKCIDKIILQMSGFVVQSTSPLLLSALRPLSLSCVSVRGTLMECRIAATEVLRQVSVHRYGMKHRSPLSRRYDNAQ